MISFKQWLDEKVFKTGKSTVEFDRGILDFQIFINPTSKELKDKKLYNARGFIDLKGNVYLVAASGNFIHTDILQLLSATVPIKNPRSFHVTQFNKLGGIPIIRIGMTNEIAFSESTLTTIT